MKITAFQGVMQCSLIWPDVSGVPAVFIFTVGTLLSTHNNGIATINTRQFINLLEKGIKVVQEINGMANNSRIAVSAQRCRIHTTIKRFGNLVCFHVQVKSGSHRNSPRHTLNTEPVSEIICYHPTTEAE
jgi:hypothetical protein